MAKNIEHAKLQNKISTKIIQKKNSGGCVRLALLHPHKEEKKKNYAVTVQKNLEYAQLNLHLRVKLQAGYFWSFRRNYQSKYKNKRIN